MKIYLASRFTNRERLHPIRKRLAELGHVVTARWLDEPRGLGAVEAATLDLIDIDACDLLVLWPENYKNDNPGYGGGRFIEFGYAMAKGKSLAVISNDSNGIFQQLPEVRHYTSWQEFFERSVTK